MRSRRQKKMEMKVKHKIHKRGTYYANFCPWKNEKNTHLGNAQCQVQLLMQEQEPELQSESDPLVNFCHACKSATKIYINYIFNSI